MCTRSGRRFAGIFAHPGRSPIKTGDAEVEACQNEQRVAEIVPLQRQRHCGQIALAGSSNCHLNQAGRAVAAHAPGFLALWSLDGDFSLASREQIGERLGQRSIGKFV